MTDFLRVGLWLKFNPLTTNVSPYVETSQLICNTNVLTGFYIAGNIVC